MSGQPDHQQALQQVVAFYQQLTAHTVSQVTAVYASDAWFKDPFNEVRGHAAILAIFRHMFVQVAAPRFVVGTRLLQGDQAFLTWEFSFGLKRQPHKVITVRGATHLQFDAAGLITMHRDYWDAAEELYEKLPLLGSLMRVLKRAARR